MFEFFVFIVSCIVVFLLSGMLRLVFFWRRIFIIVLCLWRIVMFRGVLCFF